MVERWIKSNVSSKHILIAAVVLIGVVAFYNWIIMPQTGYLMAAQRYESAAAQLTKKSQIVQKNVEHVKKNLSELQKIFKQFYTSLFDPNGADKFFSGIQNMAEEMKCVMNTLNLPPGYQSSQTGNSGAVNGVAARRATLSIAGSYKNIIKLMNKLQERPEQVKIDSINVKSMDNNSNQLKCDIAVTIYVIR
jgi:Tfp pilus assembly protein PilO